MSAETNDDMRCSLSLEILGLTRDELVVSLNYLATALHRLAPACRQGLKALATDCDRLYFDSEWVIAAYKKDPAGLCHAYLHTVLHCFLGHPFRGRGRNRALWNFCADLEAESVLSELPVFRETGAEAARKASMLSGLEQEMPLLTAELLYAKYLADGISPSDLAGPASWFCTDDHSLWDGLAGGEQNAEGLVGGTGEIPDLEGEWSRIRKQEQEGARARRKEFPEVLTRRIPADIPRGRNRYEAFLKRFAVTGEELQEDPDAFEPGLYCYGLSLYGNMPLVEPLEYQETEKVRDFVIALDTSGSCSGEPIRAFLTRTYDIIKSTESFSRKTRIHVLQADDRIRSCRLVSGDKDMDDYLKNEKLSGFGDTDFRPVFRWVDEQIRLGTLGNLRGLLYFTDGFGTYPDWAPAWEAVFAFIKGNNNAAEAPAWVTKVEFD